MTGISGAVRFGVSAPALLIMLSGGAFVAAPAVAQQAPAVAQAETGRDADQATAPRKASNQEEIVVTGTRRIAGGLMKPQTAAESMSSITPAAIQEKISVASPLQVAATLPGANFGSSDAYGLSVRNFLSVRGLDQTEIGFLIDGVPGASQSNYFPYTEAWADNENISDITLTPGNSRLQDPIINASGGEFIESIRSPNDHFGGRFSGSYGSFDARRGFLGIDTGYLGNSGVKSFVSYSYSAAHNYIGTGTNLRNHVDTRLEKNWSDQSKSTLFVSFNYLRNDRINILNLAQALDGINNNRLDVYQYSPTFTPGVTTNYWRLNRTFNKDVLVASNNDIPLTDNVKLHFSPYFKYKQAILSGTAKLSPTSIYSGSTKVTPVFDPSYLQGGALFVASVNDYFEKSGGITGYIEAHLSPSNVLTAGYWGEYAHLDYLSNLNPADTSGRIRSYKDSTALHDTTGALITGIFDHIARYTNQFFIGDTQTFFDDKLSLTLGFKELLYGTHVVNDVIGAPPRSRVSWNRAMPRFLASYKINPTMQVYANVTTNARMPLAQATYATTFNVASGAFSSVGNLAAKPEYTVSSQVGYRYTGFLTIDASAFYMKLKNHQVQGLQYINGFIQNTALNAGGETIRGATLELSTRSYYGFSVYGNTQYLKGTFDDNLPIRGDYLPTKGKRMVSAPTWIANVGGRFEKGPFYASVVWKYVGPQFSTFMNDETLPSYQTVDASVGFHFPDIAVLKAPTIRLSVTNIGNKPYIGSLSSAATNAVATRGINGTIIPAGVPLYYTSAPRAAVVIIGSNF